MSNEGRARSAALPEGAMLMGGKYRIVRKLGQGGFGITYLAEHVVLRKRVAIKEFFFQQFCGNSFSSSFARATLPRRMSPFRLTTTASLSRSSAASLSRKRS